MINSISNHCAVFLSKQPASSFFKISLLVFKIANKALSIFDRYGITFSERLDCLLDRINVAYFERPKMMQISYQANSLVTALNFAQEKLIWNISSIDIHELISRFNFDNSKINSAAIEKIKHYAETVILQKLYGFCLGGGAWFLKQISESGPVNKDTLIAIAKSFSDGMPAEACVLQHIFDGYNNVFGADAGERDRLLTEKIESISNQAKIQKIHSEIKKNEENYLDKFLEFSMSLINLKIKKEKSLSHVEIKNSSYLNTLKNGIYLAVLHKGDFHVVLFYKSPSDQLTWDPNLGLIELKTESNPSFDQFLSTYYSNLKNVSFYMTNIKLNDDLLGQFDSAIS